MERTRPEDLNLSESGFVSEEGHSGCKSQNIAIRALKGNVLSQIRFKWTYQANLVDWRGSSKKSSHLVTIVSRALQPQDGRIPCPLHRNLDFFLTSHIDFLFIFCQCGDNCKWNLFLKRKIGVTECPRSLNPNKAKAMAI